MRAAGAPSLNTRLLIPMLMLALLLSAAAANQDLLTGDLFLAKRLQEVRVGPWDETMQAVSIIGGGIPVIAMAVVFLAWCHWTRRTTERLIAGAVLLSLVVAPAIKLIVARPRPTDDLVSVWRNYPGLSFPSGHAFSAMVLFGLAYYLAPVLMGWKWGVHGLRIFSIAMIALIGVSRVYLGAHWPSDVMGGYLFGAITLAVLIYLHRLQSHRLASAQPS